MLNIHNFGANPLQLFAVLLDGIDPSESNLNHLLRKVSVTGELGDELQIYLTILYCPDILTNVSCHLIIVLDIFRSPY